MSLTQGAPLPNVNTTQTQTTSAPDWYNNYLQNIANKTSAAADNAKFIGIQPMQQASYDLANANVGNYKPSLESAKDITQGTLGMSAVNNATPLINKASTNAYDTVNNYMSPYISDVVDQIGKLGTRQIQQTLAPNTTSGIVGSGQFGSKRGAEALGQTIRDANQNILTTQTGALNTGYQSAMNQAQADLLRQGQLGLGLGALTTSDINSRLAAGSNMGTLAKMTQDLGIGDVSTLNQLGTQQQTILQNEQLFPLQLAGLEAAPIRGFQMPMTSTASFVGPQAGSYQPSDLSSILGGGTLLAALTKGGNDSALSGITGALSKLFGSSNPYTAAGYDPSWMNTLTTNGTKALSPYESAAGVNFAQPDVYG
jgi:hypothetical protein